jgi:D-alanyl-D-alanine carboxypeptidase
VTAGHRNRVLSGAALALAVLLTACGGGLLDHAPPPARPLESERRAILVVDAETGATLQAEHASGPRYPASLTKMMTLYVTFDALRRGTLTWDQPMQVSAFAATRPPTRLGLRAGDTLVVRDAVLGLITKSANDAAVVLAEAIAGTEADFARQATLFGRRLGMTGTEFTNASGLPDPDQVTTARDMAKLARALVRDFPDEYALFATQRFTFKGTRFDNHNHLLGVVEGVDGIKTGYTRASGFHLVASATRGGRRVIAVVMGAPSGPERDAEAALLLELGFERLGLLPRVAAAAAPRRREEREERQAEPRRSAAVIRPAPIRATPPARFKRRRQATLPSAGRSALAPQA